MRRALSALAFLALVMVGCDSGPSGPGTLTARVEGTDVGGAVLEISGPGIRSFAARGATRIYSAPVPARRGVHRVVLVHPDGGVLSFDMEVDDVGMEGPAVTVISVAGTDNRVVPGARARVRIER